MPIVITRPANSRDLAASPSNDNTALPVDPFVAAYHDDLGPRTSDTIETLIAELGVHSISSRNLTGRTFNFAEGTALGLRLEEKIHKSEDAYVLESPVRSAIIDRLKSENRGKKVVFVETSGVTELGGGFMATAPLAVSPFGGVGWGYGVTASSLFRYRRSLPVSLSFAERPTDAANRRQIRFPFSAQVASEMEPASEIELTGQGHISGGVGVAGSVGLALPGVATAGIGAVVGASTSLKGEMSVNVLALDRPGRVRVTIRKLDEEAAGFLARIRLGLNFASGGITGPLAGGLLRLYVEKMGASNFEELVNFYTTLNASIFGGFAQRGIHIGSWDFDLNNPAARSAYEKLVMLNTSEAERLALQQGSGVTQFTAEESETEFRFGADVGMLGERLLLSETLNTEREGSIDSSSGKKLIYRDSIFTKRKKNILMGHQEISWEAVSIRDLEKEIYEPYLHLAWRQRDWDFGRNRIARTLRFAEALSIPKSQMIGEDAKLLDVAVERLLRLFEVNLSTDIYFTKTGIENIDRADATAARAAFLKVSSLVRKKFKDVDFNKSDQKTKAALELIAEYHSLIGIQNIAKAAERLKVVPQLRKEYAELTGRKIATDAKLIAQADRFGAIVEKLNDTRNPGQVAWFFQAIGRERKFDYMQSVAALAILAGPEETLINEVSISGKGVSIKNVSEGSIENPRERIARQLHRLASV